jgi:hypothetical protein
MQPAGRRRIKRGLGNNNYRKKPQLTIKLNTKESDLRVRKG